MIYQKKFVEISNGEKIAYIHEGSGEKVLVLLHGNMSSSAHYSLLIEDLEKDFNIIAIDMRGFGDSSYKNSFSHLDELADDVIEVLDKIGVDKFNILGWSAGGGVAMSVALKCGDRVEQLVLLESMACSGYPVLKKGPDGKVIPGSFYSSREEVIKDPIQIAPVQVALEAGNSAFMDYLWSLTMYNDGNVPEPEMKAYLLSEVMKERCLFDLDWALCTYNISNYFNGYVNGTNKFNDFKCKILHIWGTKDIVVPPLMDACNDILPNRKKVIVEGAGHAIAITFHKELASVLKENL